MSLAGGDCYAHRYDVDGHAHIVTREMQWRRNAERVWGIYDPDSPEYSMPQRM